MTRRNGTSGPARLLGALLLAVAVAAAAGCAGPAQPAGGGREGRDGHENRRPSAQPAAVAALRAAGRATEQAGSARVESSTTLGPDDAMTSSGSLAWADGLTGTLTVGYTGGDVAAALRELGTTSMQARYLPDAYYARLGDAFAAQAGGRHWIRYDWDDLAGLGGAAGPYLAEQIREAAPHRAVELLLAAGDVHRVGTETVRGERTTRYRGTARTADIGDRELREGLGRAGVTEQTLDLWVGTDGLLVKKVEKDRTATGELTQTCYYGDYGVPVHVEPPPAADTRDFTDVMRSAPGAS